MEDDENPIFVNGFVNIDLAVYDYDKCVKILMKRDKMTAEQAVEFMEYNTVGAYVGPRTPVFVETKEEDE